MLLVPTERLIKPNRLIRDSRLVVLYQSGVDCSGWTILVRIYDWTNLAGQF